MTLALDVPVALTPRERKIVELVAEGMQNSEIAAEIGISCMVIKNYLRVIYDKVGMFSRLELALWAIQHEAN